MKYADAEKQIKELSSKYDINMENVDFAVNYKNKLVAWVKGDERYLLFNIEKYFKKLPFSDKLYMILSELAITPLNERKENKKYYVKVFNNGFGYLNIDILNDNVVADTKSETDHIKTKFTNEAIEQLKKREDVALDWNKVTLLEVD